MLPPQPRAALLVMTFPSLSHRVCGTSLSQHRKPHSPTQTLNPCVWTSRTQAWMVLVFGAQATCLEITRVLDMTRYSCSSDGRGGVRSWMAHSQQHMVLSCLCSSCLTKPAISSPTPYITVSESRGAGRTGVIKAGPSSARLGPSFLAG